MSQSAPSWLQTFTDLFHASVKGYQSGRQDAASLLNPGDRSFLDSIGHTGQEFFDFVEDFAKGGEPTMETALEIATVRRDYFLQEQKGFRSKNTISVATLPAKSAELGGIEWLPRLIPKAVAKLRGEMPHELMFCCGGDRRFFRTHQIEPAAFLRETWKTNGSPDALLQWVKANSRALPVSA